MLGNHVDLRWEYCASDGVFRVLSQLLLICWLPMSNDFESRYRLFEIRWGSLRPIKILAACYVVYFREPTVVGTSYSV